MNLFAHKNDINQCDRLLNSYRVIPQCNSLQIKHYTVNARKVVLVFVTKIWWYEMFGQVIFILMKIISDYKSRSHYKYSKYDMVEKYNVNLSNNLFCIFFKPRNNKSDYLFLSISSTVDMREMWCSEDLRRILVSLSILHCFGLCLVQE